MIGNIINIDSEILGGTPVFFGTRVPIKNLFDYLETGETIELFSTLKVLNCNPVIATRTKKEE
jgi:uncharacterized protein (DUF433 family)